jgi:hypothetical protein
VYVCEKTGFAIDGSATKSQVTCRGNIQQCSIVYGACRCGDTSLLDFPTTIEGTNVDVESDTLCDFYGDKVPCNQINPSCHLSKNRCKNTDNRWLICEGSFAFCSIKYGGMCLCGLEQKGYS